MSHHWTSWSCNLHNLGRPRRNGLGDHHIDNHLRDLELNQILIQLRQLHARAAAAWGALSSRRRVAVLGGAGVFSLVLGFLLFSGGRPCGERADVEARVAALTSAMQADAASGKISVTELAVRVKRVNAAATAFETSKDLGAYCEALDTLGDEFRPQ